MDGQKTLISLNVLNLYVLSNNFIEVKIDGVHVEEPADELQILEA